MRVTAPVLAGLRTGAVAAATVAWMACGAARPASPAPPAAGAATAPAKVAKAAPAEVLPAPSVEIDVQSRRMGGSIRLDIKGTGRNHREGQAIENPENWSVLVRADSGETLQRLVNGSTHVERHPVGPVRHNLWDVEVKFSVAFTLPATCGAVDVLVVPPGEEPRTVTIADLAEPAAARPEPAKKRAKKPAKRSRARSRPADKAPAPAEKAPAPVQSVL